VARPTQTSSGSGSLLRSVAVGLVAATAGFLAMLAYQNLVAEADGVRRYAVAAALLLAAVATGAMAYDLFDLWLRGRRMTPFSVKMTRSLIFVTLLVALLLTFAFRGPSLFLPLTPALVVYLVATWRRPEAQSRGGRRPAERGGGKGRQRRGGRKR
jgi:hypothetical protein